MIQLALRNLWRNKIRTAITLAAVAGGLGLIIMSMNLNHVMYQDLIKNGISTIAGHVVVQPRGWKADPDPTERSLEDGDAIAARVAAASPEGVVTQRIFLGGLLQSPANSVAVAVTAIKPALEQRVSQWHENISEGEWLKPDDSRGILIGSKVAETLDVRVGNKVVLMAQGKDDVESKLFRVRGLVSTGSKQMDGVVALVTVEAAQSLLVLPGAVSQVSLHLPSSAGADAATAAISESFAAPADAEVEVLGWKEAVSEVYQFTVTDRKTNNAFMFLIGIIVAFGIINTILMSVMERIREFGVMLALGTPPTSVRAMIVAEGFFIGAGGALLGLAFGGAMTQYLVTNGLDYGEISGAALDIGGATSSSVIYAQWDWVSTVVYMSIAIVLAMVSTVYPAWKAGALKPVEAMRHV